MVLNILVGKVRIISLFNSSLYKFCEGWLRWETRSVFLLTFKHRKRIMIAKMYVFNFLSCVMGVCAVLFFLAATYQEDVAAHLWIGTECLIAAIAYHWIGKTSSSKNQDNGQNNIILHRLWSHSTPWRIVELVFNYTSNVQHSEWQIRR